MGKRGPKLTKAARAKAEARIVELDIRGWPQVEIAAEVGLSQGRVSQVLKQVAERYKTQVVADVEAERARKVAEVRHLRRELYDAWERSKLERQISETEKSDGAGEGKGGRKAKLRREGRDGNPAYVTAILACDREEAELRGLYPPRRQELSGIDGAPIETTASVILVPAKVDRSAWEEIPKDVARPAEADEGEDDDA